METPRAIPQAALQARAALIARARQMSVKSQVFKLLVTAPDGTLHPLALADSWPTVERKRARLASEGYTVVGVEVLTLDCLANCL